MKLYNTEPFILGSRFQMDIPSPPSNEISEGFAVSWDDEPQLIYIAAYHLEGKRFTIDDEEVVKKDYLRILYYPSFQGWVKPDATMVQHLREYGVSVDVVNMTTGKVR